MFKGSGDNVCTAAHNCLKRTGAALEVNNLDIQTFVFEDIGPKVIAAAAQAAAMTVRRVNLFIFIPQ